MKNRIVISFVLLFCLNVPTTGGGITIPPITEKTLPNGLKLVLVENHELPVVYMNI